MKGVSVDKTQQMNKKKLITMVLSKPLTHTGTHKIVCEVKNVTQLNTLLYIVILEKQQVIHKVLDIGQSCIKY